MCNQATDFELQFSAQEHNFTDETNSAMSNPVMNKV